MSRTFNVWLLSFLIQSLIILTAGYFGFFKMLWLYDITYLAFVAFALWLIASFSAGKRAYGLNSSEDWQWFTSEQFMYLGLLGTAIGIAHGLLGLQGLNPADTTATMAKMLVFVTGIASALLVTISSIVASSFLKVQLVIIDHFAQKVEITNTVQWKDPRVIERDGQSIMLLTESRNEA